MSTFPITSEQLRELNPNALKSYSQILKEESAKILDLVYDQAKRGASTADIVPIENPQMNVQYMQYVNDLVNELRKNLLSCKFTLYDRYDNTVRLTIDWSQDFMNPEEMFSD